MGTTPQVRQDCGACLHGRQEGGQVAAARRRRACSGRRAPRPGTRPRASAAAWATPAGAMWWASGRACRMRTPSTGLCSATWALCLQPTEGSALGQVYSLHTFFSASDHINLLAYAQKDEVCEARKCIFMGALMRRCCSIFGGRTGYTGSSRMRAR